MDVLAGAVRDLPSELYDVVVGSYNDALTPVFVMLIPMVVAGLVLALFIKEVPLRASIEPVETATAADQGARS